jgi:hypothetical protein
MVIVAIYKFLKLDFLSIRKRFLLLERNYRARSDA